MPPVSAPALMRFFCRAVPGPLEFICRWYEVLGRHASLWRNRAPIMSCADQAALEIDMTEFNDLWDWLAYVKDSNAYLIALPSFVALFLVCFTNWVERHLPSIPEQPAEGQTPAPLWDAKANNAGARPLMFASSKTTRDVAAPTVGGIAPKPGGRTH